MIVRMSIKHQNNNSNTFQIFLLCSLHAKWWKCSFQATKNQSKKSVNSHSPNLSIKQSKCKKLIRHYCYREWPIFAIFQGTFVWNQFHLINTSNSVFIETVQASIVFGLSFRYSWVNFANNFYLPKKWLGTQLPISI